MRLSNPSKMMVSNWLIETMKKLGETGVDSPRRDTLVLLEDTLDKDRAWVLANPDYELKNTELKTVDTLIKQRISREPLAYIRGKAWFYGRFFTVNPDVLIPRPESEDFIDILKELQPKAVIDIGTGSGVLAITTKLELPEIKVIATDTDTSALKIAEKNAHNYNVAIEFLQGSLLEPLQDLKLQDYTIITNLPYVPDSLITSPEIKTEPKLALFSGADGLDHYRKFWEQTKNLPQAPQHVLTESLENQHEQIEKLAEEAGYKPVKTEGLVQVFKDAN